MAITQTEVRAKTVAPKNTRRNEIIAIALFALSVLLTLCMIPFSYNPNDPSGNSSASGPVHNWIGIIGSYIAESLFQFFGLAAYLLPLLLFAAAWRRFRTKRIQAPLSRVIGLATLLIAASALLQVFGAPEQFDRTFKAGGVLGYLIAKIFMSGFNTVGAAILLFALAATGLLLATNFSFVRAYEWLAAEFGTRFTFTRAIPERFKAWRIARRERAQMRMEMRQAARAEREQLREVTEKLRDKTGADRVADFMREELPVAEGTGLAGAAIQRAARTAQTVATSAQSAQSVQVAEGIKLESAAVAASASDMGVTQPRTIQTDIAATATKRARVAPSGDELEVEEADEIEAMVKSASVIRTDVAAEEAQAATPERPAKRGLIAQTPTDYKLPHMEFLHEAPPHSEQADEELLNLATRLAEKCKEFNVTGQIKHICPGPVVTTYEFKPDPGVKYSRVTGLVDDLCLALKAESIRIDRMPGKPHVGIEVPNPHRETIHLREVVESRQFRESASKLTIALGKTIDGLNYVADLAKMPHLLIAGATGAGKSVGVNSLIVSILYKARPDEVKFIMVDPKRLELGLYDGIPHLATPIITDPKRAAISLKWAVSEMEKRYKELAGWGVRNIDGYNAEVERRNFAKDFDEAGEPWKTLPYIVIIIDELADLMMVSGHDVEEAITRLAQMARAVGIHLVLATQRPSVDVITGLIKANFPSRISYRVSSKVDSRTIIDANGAEQLLGRGDMLFLPPGTSRLVRVHGAYVDETEIGKIVAHVKKQCAPAYDETITQSEEEALGLDGGGGERDELFEDALRICAEMKRASTSVLQRRLRIGYGRAAAILDMMEREGFIGQADGARPRPILQKAYEMLADWDAGSDN
jgi:S-DNA-T family DNA segregation ATPase FtsK/SpoIIIE